MQLSKEESQSKLLKAYEDYLESLGCRHIRVPITSKSQTGLQTQTFGQWTVGPPGTYIFAYILQSWPKLVKRQVLQQLTATLSYPEQIAKYMFKKCSRVEGMNYLTTQTVLGECIRSFNFGLTSYSSQSYDATGTPRDVTLRYFSKRLAYLSTDITPIADYLMEGMQGLQKLARRSRKQEEVQDQEEIKNQKSCAQILCLVSATVYGTMAIISTSMFGVVCSEKTKEEIKKADCKATEQTTFRIDLKIGSYLLDPSTKNSNYIQRLQAQAAQASENK